MSQTLCPDLNVNLLPPHSLKEENIVNMTSRCSSLLAVTSVVSVIRPHSFRTCPDLVFVWFCVPLKYKRIFKQDQALAVRCTRVVWRSGGEGVEVGSLYVLNVTAVK